MSDELPWHKQSPFLDLEGRPRRQFIESMLQHVASGQSLMTWCAEAGNPRRDMIARWLAADPKLRDALTEARKAAVPFMAEEVLAIADMPPADALDLQHAQHQVKVRQWLMSKLSSLYGDKVDVQVTEHVSDDELARRVAKLLDTARARLQVTVGEPTDPDESDPPPLEDMLA